MRQTPFRPIHPKSKSTLPCPFGRTIQKRTAWHVATKYCPSSTFY
ncbi:hypothetical protein Z949_964 [Sulfitobacter guttiformis KCTC 32187]|nr:hypothetical protein Z949_964 [Sulfitobacter guttiformis KCTC 32187]